MEIQDTASSLIHPARVGRLELTRPWSARVVNDGGL
jgi:hypothetical protein